jgi:hypothetical protein
MAVLSCLATAQAATITQIGAAGSSGTDGIVGDPGTDATAGDGRCGGRCTVNTDAINRATRRR